jgi:alanine racemase
MSRPTRALVDLAAIRHNYRHAKALARPARAVAVIKANAYGHGALAVAQALANDADAYGVACLEEALELRESGVANPILVLEGVFEPDELELVDTLQLTMVVHNQAQLNWLERARPQRKIGVWLKMDSGMHRLGMPPHAFREAYHRIKRLVHVNDVVLMSHFARADEIDQACTQRQIACFEAHVGNIASPRSLANSPATLAWPAAHGDWIRPGIMLYGVSPFKADYPTVKALQPAMRLESRLIAIRDLLAGEAVGYGGRYVCERPQRIGVVAIGYGDGYPRHAPDGTPIAVRGVRTRIVGRVSMDMLTVDLTPIRDAMLGDPVELWGNQVLANEVATASDTIAYELFTGISRRVPLHYES